MDKTLVEWSLGGPLPKLCPSKIATVIKYRKIGWYIFKNHELLSQLQPNICRMVLYQTVVGHPHPPTMMNWFNIGTNGKITWKSSRLKLLSILQPDLVKWFLHGLLFNYVGHLRTPNNMTFHQVSVRDLCQVSDTGF